jgi:hypothetical protein
VSSPFLLAHHKKIHSHFEYSKKKDYVAFPFGLGHKGRFLGAHYQIQYGAIGNSLRDKWELEKHIGSIIENHWEQGGNTKIQKKSENQPYTPPPILAISLDAWNLYS